MKLASLDLNLLVALDALLEERHVSRAGRRVGLSQPAMSNVLARLRQLLNDELLVRTSNGMQLTQRAAELAGPLQLALRQLEHVLSGNEEFDPRRSHRAFTLAMADYTTLVVLPRLKRLLSSHAPGIDLVVVNAIRRQGVTVVEKGEADIAIGLLPEPPPNMHRQWLFRDRLICIARRDHPAFASKLTLDRYLSLSHISVRGSNESQGAIEQQLERLGHQRRVEVVVPNFLVVPMLLAKTDLVATEAERLATAFSGLLRLATRDAPFDCPAIEISQIWHARSERDAGHRWLRELIASLMTEE